MTAFAHLSLSPALQQAVDVLGFTTMTPVQEQALPPILAGKDVIAQARTGSGKTAAFGLGILSMIDPALPKPQALVLCPTRELADQVSAELRRLARFIANVKVVTLCGGVPVRTQTPSLAHPPQIIVGTPGRILDHLRRVTLSFDVLRVLVLDEADRMLDMGFGESIAEVIAQIPAKRQTLLFSATYPSEIRALSKNVQDHAVNVTVDPGQAADDLEQIFYEVAPVAKVGAVSALLDAYRPESALVFCHTRRDTRDVATSLTALGYSVLALHGELEQRDRDEVLIQFAHKSCSVLVATDVAARGLDIKGLPLVIAFELPTDPDIHVHRVGRTGRAGEKGIALSLCAPNERDRARTIAARGGGHANLRWEKLPEPPRVRQPPAVAPMVTLLIEGGRQDKLRPGDVLGALTGDAGIPGDSVGKIDVLPARTYVSVRREAADKAVAGLRKGKIKGRTFRVRPLRQK